MPTTATIRESHQHRELPRIRIHCFVYGGDSDIIEEAALCALQAIPEAHFIVIDDAFDPCPPELRLKLMRVGVEWRQSQWARCGNLRGGACIRGILDELLAVPCHDDDILVKLDADTCLMNGDDIRQFAMNSNAVVCAAGDPDVRLYGMCYGIRAMAARKTREYLSEVELSDDAAEDVVIGLSLIRLFPDSENRIIYKTDAKGATWTAYNWWFYPDVEPYARASVITTGNPLPPPLSKTQRSVMMKKLRLMASERLRREAKSGARAWGVARQS